MIAWSIVGWVLLVAGLLIYIGGIVQVLTTWKGHVTKQAGKFVTACALAVVWPWAIGAALVEWIGDQT